MKTTHRELWDKLQAQGLVNGECLELQHALPPWYIRAMQGFSGWIAALFLLGFFATILSSSLRSNEAVLIAIGLTCCGSAFLLFKVQQKNDFLNQLGLVVSLCGQLIVAWGLFEWFSHKEVGVYFVLCGFQAGLALMMSNFLHRALSSWFAMIALFWGLSRLGIYGLSSVTAAAGFILIWLNEINWGKRRALWEPVGYGIALSLVQFNGQLLFSRNILSWYEQDQTGWLYAAAPWITSVLVAMTILYLLIQLLNKNKIAFTSRAGLLASAGCLLLIVIGLPVVGASSAVLILLIGFANQRRSLMGLGVVALLSFLSWYYYNLDATLLNKSYFLISVGITLLVGRFIARYCLGESHQDHLKDVQPKDMSVAKWIGVGTVVLGLIAVNLTIYNKEQVLASGRIVLLQLAPVDPRSLMQGDYMRLRFAIARKAFDLETKKHNQDGHIIVSLNEHKVGSFIGFYQGETLLENQVKMQYRIRNRKVQFATNAFFFQEGTAKEYELARYGEFRVANNGELLLNTLRDENYKVLGFNSP
ncbi:MAG: putative membrane-anchored protein [Candidatus Endobugula sp.]|jgi:uncharacterized membrane-anchored protein